MIYKDGVQGHRSGGNEVFENCMSPGPRGTGVKLVGAGSSNKSNQSAEVVGSVAPPFSAGKSGLLHDA